VAPVVSISVGAATTRTGDVPEPGALLREADERLYAAKRQGRNCVVAEALDPA
jgi:PleD family two-component response regulator